MTNETYNKAQKIQDQIADFEKLHLIVAKPFQRYFLTTPKKLGISSYKGDSVTVCEDGLTNLIREYCDKRLQELRDELAAL